MKLATRRIVFLLFLAIFLVVAPSLIIYGLGYKYDWQKKQLEKTGVFFVKSFPKNSQISLDGEINSKNTPTQITRLLPKIYQVSVFQPGFRPWNKNLPIYPQTTTFIEDVSLIYEKFEESKIAGGNFTGFLTDNGNQQIAVVEHADKSDILWLYDLSGDNFKKLYTAPKSLKISLTSWSLSDKKILFKEGNNFKTLNIDNQTIVNLSSKSKLVLTDFRWDPINDNLIYGLNQSNLIKLNLTDGETKKIVLGGVIDFLPVKNKLVYISKVKSQQYLNLWQNNKSEIMVSLPQSGNYEFKALGQDKIGLFDRAQNLLYFLNPDNLKQPLDNVLSNITDFRWHDRQMLYWNNLELWAYYPETGNKILLERTSQTIQNGMWHPNASYVYAVIGGQLKFYELDGRDQRNIYDIINLDSGAENFLATSKKGEYLYLVKLQGDVPGFYKEKIQP